jgi:hypothetical protein
LAKIVRPGDLREHLSRCRARGRLAAVADVQQRKINEMAGAELGYRYADSSIVDGVPGGPEYLFQNTGPAWPDAGLPYLWLSDGTPVQDRVPLFGFTLLRLTNRAESPPVEAAFRARGVPLQVVLIQGHTTRSVYGRVQSSSVLTCMSSGGVTSRPMTPAAWSPSPQVLAKGQFTVPHRSAS